ncbi:aldo/keto reductase [Planctomycetota bacterium]
MKYKKQDAYGKVGKKLKKGLKGAIPPLSRRNFVKLAGLVGTSALCSSITAEENYIKRITAEPEYRNYQPDIMGYRRLGKTNLMVSELSLGGASAYGDGGPSASSDPEAYRSIMQKLLDLGVNYFDTSPPSDAYDTEDKYAFLSGSNRDKVFISSKVDSVDPTRLRKYVEDSLSSIQTDHLDIVYNHKELGVTEKGDFTEALRGFDVMDKLKEEGKMRFSGFSGHSAPVIKTLLEKYSDRVDVILGFYAPGHNWVWSDDPLEDWQEVYEIAREKDVGVVGMKMFLSGMDTWASRVAALEKESAAMKRLQPFLDKGHSLPQACLGWALQNENINSFVVGMRTMAEVEEDFGAITPKSVHTELSHGIQKGLQIKAFPNTFQEFTSLKINAMSADANTLVTIRNVSGKTIKIIQGGSNRVINWNGKNTQGMTVAPGRYFAFIQSGGASGTISLTKT